MATTPVYAFDPTGVLAANKITGEQHVLTAANYRDFHFVVPTYAPFFMDGLVVKFRGVDNVVRTLVEGVDYLLTHWFISASRACAKPIYGSISFLDLQLNGVVIVDYQTLGGDWLQDPTKISEILADTLHNPRTTAFDQVIDMPYSFPVIDHAWDLTDLVGASSLVQALADIELTLRTSGSASGTAHAADLNNPHQTTKAQVGLGNLQNYPIADGPTAIAGVSGVHYMTPFGVKQALDAGPNAAITAHVNNVLNPHQVTAAQVGAYSQAQVNTLLAGKLATTGTAADTTKFDAKTAVEYRDWVLLGTAANATRFGGMTVAEFSASVGGGTATDTTKFDGKTYEVAKADILSGKAADSTLFDGHTYAAAKADILAGTATNASKFGDLTPLQWSDSFDTKINTLRGEVENLISAMITEFNALATRMGA